MSEDASALDAIAERAEAAWSRGDRARAEQLARMGLGVDADNPRLLAVLAAIADREGRAEEAALLFRQALSRARDDPATLHNLGVSLRNAGLPEAADAAWSATLAQEPTRRETLFNLARLRDTLGRREEALALLRRILDLDPDNGPALYTLGNLLARMGRAEEAEVQLRRALAVDPTDRRAATNLGVVLRRLDRVEEALAVQREAVARAPDFADAQWNLANLLLCLDQYEEGFAGYEWRRRRAAWTLPDPPGPEWTGEPLAGKRLLVAVEQGAGDMIQAVRWIPALAAMGARVSVEVHPPLMSLVETVEGVDRVLPFGSVPEDGSEDGYDLWVRAFSLPWRLGLRFEDLPAGPIPYLRVPASAAPSPVRREGGGLHVGLCWSGNPDFADNATRACDLADLLPLTRIPGIRLFSLQKGTPGQRLAELAPDGITDLSGAMTDYAATAAILETLDLVVSTDTSMVHLAGALGRPCALLLAAHCDWRWGRGRATSPWYPSLRLIRQARLGDWRAPVAALGEMLLKRECFSEEEYFL